MVLLQKSPSYTNLISPKASVEISEELNNLLFLRISKFLRVVTLDLYDTPQIPLHSLSNFLQTITIIKLVGCIVHSTFLVYCRTIFSIFFKEASMRNGGDGVSMFRLSSIGRREAKIIRILVIVCFVSTRHLQNCIFSVSDSILGGQFLGRAITTTNQEEGDDSSFSQQILA